MSLKSLLSANGWMQVSKDMARLIGLQEAVLFSELLSKETYFAEKGQLTEDGFFFCTIENLENDTTLKEKVQTKCIKKLMSENLVDYRVQGMPGRRYFKCCSEETLQKFLLSGNETVDVSQFRQNGETAFPLTNSNSQFRQKDESSFAKTEKVVSPFGRSNKKENKQEENKTSSKEKDLSEGLPSTQKTFFCLPEKLEPVSAKKKNKAEIADERIVSAKQTGDWSSVNDTNFAHYYIKKHNEVFQSIVFNHYTDVSIIRDAFIQRHNIPKEQVCDYIDAVIQSHKVSKDFPSLTFNMLNKNTKMLNDLIRMAQTKLKTFEKKFMTYDEQEDSKHLKTASDSYLDNDLF